MKVPRGAERVEGRGRYLLPGLSDMHAHLAWRGRINRGEMLGPIGQNRLKGAIGIFKFNVEAYPKSANTYDSLAEAYPGAGEKKLAADFCKRALEVDPDYPAARELLKKLEAEPKATP